MVQKSHSLLYTKWRYKYHILYRRKVVYNQYRSSLSEVFHRLCSYKEVEIIS